MTDRPTNRPIDGHRGEGSKGSYTSNNSLGEEKVHRIGYKKKYARVGTDQLILKQTNRVKDKDGLRDAPHSKIAML